MVKSMTGYGKAECLLPDGKITIELRSLNGKSADISIKTSIIPREKELEVRQFIAKQLQRGNIDLYANFEQNSADNAKVINKDIFAAYYKQALELNSVICRIQKEYQANGGCIQDTFGNAILGDTVSLFPAILKFPDVIEVKKQEINEESWEKLYAAIVESATSINEFRTKEGAILYKDITARVALIESYISEVEQYEAARTQAIKERIKSRIDDLGINPDENRLEQEIIFYIEKLDINEEKVRLRQHCNYFMETINKEEYPGKKLGFIAQEMGREINTMGSKANHADIQQWVVKMKDELEKIKEQSLNIL
ncbi:MAG: YicC/YloC family endoribonuclease [Bacteroidales bacterium]